MKDSCIVIFAPSFESDVLLFIRLKGISNDVKIQNDLAYSSFYMYIFSSLKVLSCEISEMLFENIRKYSRKDFVRTVNDTFISAPEFKIVFLSVLFL